MAVKIRLKRRGRKSLALYDVVIADGRAPRDGRFIEKIGTYNPNTNPALVQFSEDRALSWLLKGAQPTDTVRAMLSYRGVLLKKHLQIGVQKQAITQKEADTRYNAWKKQKEKSIADKIAHLKKAKADAEKLRLEAETQVSEKRAAKQSAAAVPPQEDIQAAQTAPLAASEKPKKETTAEATEKPKEETAAEATEKPKEETTAETTEKPKEETTAETTEKPKEEAKPKAVEPPKENAKKEAKKLPQQRSSRSVSTKQVKAAAPDTDSKKLGAKASQGSLKISSKAQAKDTSTDSAKKV